MYKWIIRPWVNIKYKHVSKKRSLQEGIWQIAVVQHDKKMVKYDKRNEKIPKQGGITAALTSKANSAIQLATRDSFNRALLLH